MPRILAGRRQLEDQEGDVRTLGHIKTLVTPKMYNNTIYVFFRLLCSYTFRRNFHLQGAYTKISLKRTVINGCTINIHVSNTGFG
jgi:hypothetical protein